MDTSINGHVAQADGISKWVWYSDTDALKQGEAVCHNTDYGTPASIDTRRVNYVERPSTSNQTSFAGVAARNYSANSGGQFIEIYVPGSKGILVALAVDTVIDTGLLTFQVGGGTGAGRFYTGKYKGRGSAIPRQTVAEMLESGMTGGTISVSGTDGKTVTVADSSDMAVGDTLVIVGGECDGTSVLVPGKYSIDSITAGGTTTIVLTSSCLSTLTTGSITLTGYIYTGNIKAQVDLLEGDESGGIEFLSVPNAAGSSMDHMVGGVSYVCGGLTLSEDAEVELALGKLPGEQKAFICLGTLTSYVFVIDLATSNGWKLAGTRDLAEVGAIAAAADAAYFEYGGVYWRLTDITGNAAEA